MSSKLQNYFGYIFFLWHKAREEYVDTLCFSLPDDVDNWLGKWW